VTSKGGFFFGLYVQVRNVRQNPNSSVAEDDNHPEGTASELTIEPNKNMESIAGANERTMVKPKEWALTRAKGVKDTAPLIVADGWVISQQAKTYMIV
jgi:hypothetical protein